MSMRFPESQQVLSAQAHDDHGIHHQPTSSIAAMIARQILDPRPIRRVVWKVYSGGAVFESRKRRK